MTKKVLIFSLNYYPRFIGGAEVAIKEITDRLPDIEFHMVTLRFDSTLPKVEKIGNVLVHRIGFTKPEPGIADLRRFPLHINKHAYQYLAARKAASLHKAHRYDAVWAMMAHAAGIPAAHFKTFHPKVRYLLTLQEGDPPAHIEKLMRPVWPLFRRAFTKADHVQAISSFLLDWSRRMGFPKEGEVVPNGVSLAHFSQAFPPEEVAFVKEGLGKKKGDVFLVTTSRLVHKNGVDTIIDALPELPGNIRLVIAGVGPLERALQARIEMLKIPDRVIFLGEVPHSELPLLLSACDIFIRPSRSEGMGNSFIEAMAAGLPVIATQEGGLSDFLFDRVRNPDKEPTGFAVDKDDPKRIAATVQAIIADPVGTKQVVKNARALVERYDWSAIAERMRGLFDTV
ncbi:MAG TPA: glycosyltransferase family 4 protein [Candidatus Paceibacterota bacterium]|jgi:glycosyltransferase involved in cell wall biosynthesis